MIGASVMKELSTFFIVIDQALRSRGAGGSSALPKFSVNVPFFSKSDVLDVSFLKEVIENVNGNQYSTRVS